MYLIEAVHIYKYGQRRLLHRTSTLIYRLHVKTKLGTALLRPAAGYNPEAFYSDYSVSTELL